MAFWPMLGGIAAQVGTRLLETFLEKNNAGTARAPPPAQAPYPTQAPPSFQATQPKRDDIVGVCQRVYEGDLDPVDAVGNMRRNLYQQDPKVIKMALKVMESVLEERGIPARNNDEASQFLNDMRELLRNSSDRGVKDGIFELNQAWSRACRNSSHFRGVGDLVDLLNAEGYRVIVTQDNHMEIKENIGSASRSICDAQLPFDPLKQLVRAGDRNSDEEDVKMNLVVPRHVAENPEGWTITVQCTKSENVGSKDNAQNEKKYNNELKSTLEDSRDKLFEKDVWQEECRQYSSKGECQAEDMKLAIQRSTESEMEDMNLAIQRSTQSAIEDMEMQIALEISRRESVNEERKSDEYETRDEQELQDTRRGARKKATNKAKGNFTSWSSFERQEEEGEIFLDIRERQRLKKRSGKGATAFEVHSGHSSGKENNRYRSKEYSEKPRQQERSPSGSEDDDERSEDDNTKPACNCKHAKDKSWEEQEALERAMIISLEEFKQKEHSLSGSQYNGKSSAVERKSNKNETFCCKYAEDKSWEEQEALERAMRISLEEFKQKERSASGSQNGGEGSAVGNISKSQQEYCCRHAKDKGWEEEEALEQAIRISMEEFKEVASHDSRKPNLACGKDSSVESTGTLSRAEELRQQRLRYFEKEISKKELESPGHCSKQDTEFPERNEKQWEEDCHTPDAERNKIAMIEDAEMKLAMQLSLQEMLEKEQNDSSEDDSALNENDDTDSSSENSGES